MVRIEDESNQQIANLISNRGNDYVHLVKEVRNILESYKMSIEGKNAIYEIRSRGNYQDGNELKTPESILKKIIERQRQGRPYYSIKDVEDIVGIRVICVYPSDVESVKTYITKKESRLRLHDQPEFVTRSSGYRALHITVNLNKPLELQDLKCDIQIVTMLQEAWSFKAHDLVYKPGWRVDKDFELLTSCLSDLLASLDQQSELIKSQIERMQKTEEQHRVNAIRDHQMELISKEPISELNFMKYYNKKHINFDNVDDPHTGMQLLKYLVNDINIEGINDEDIDDVISNLNVYEEKFKIFDTEKIDDENNFGLCEDLSRIILFVSLIEITGKYRTRALGYSDKLIWRFSDESINLAKAHLFKGRVLSAFKRYDEALAETEKSMEIDELSNVAKNNWAYFAAEYVDEQRKLTKSELTAIEIKALTEKAFELSKQSIEGETDTDTKLQNEDTLGFVKIVLSDKPEEVKEGLDICRRSLQADPNQELANLYLRRHEILAYQRLLDLLR